MGAFWKHFMEFFGVTVNQSTNSAPRVVNASWR